MNIHKEALGTSIRRTVWHDLCRFTVSFPFMHDKEDENQENVTSL